MKNEPQKYKAKKMIVSADMLLNIGKGKFEVFADILPADIKLLSVKTDEKTKTVELIVESESFPEVDSLENLEIITAPIIKPIK